MRYLVEYRNFTITAELFGFNCDSVNCFGARSEEAAKRAIDRYLNGDNDPQCRLTNHEAH